MVRHLWGLTSLVVVLCLIGSGTLFAVSSEERDGKTLYILSQEELDKTIVMGEQKKAIEAELKKALVQLEREKRWKKFTLSFSLPTAGYLILREVNPNWGPVVGVISGAALAWLLVTLLD